MFDIVSRTGHIENSVAIKGRVNFRESKRNENEKVHNITRVTYNSKNDDIRIFNISYEMQPTSK